MAEIVPADVGYFRRLNRLLKPASLASGTRALVPGHT
jgi:hypothetical protein